jgi:ubiquilin
MSSPEFMQQMSAVMSNPAVLDQIIAMNPQLAAMGPQVRELFQSERFRQLVYGDIPLIENTLIDM